MSAPDDYRTLRPDLILKTLDKLHERIIARFPQSGLGRVCADLQGTAAEIVDEAADLARPAWGWRIAAAVVALLGLAAQIWAAEHFRVEGASSTELLQGLEAAVNLLILFGGGVWFLMTLEERLKRQRVLDALHRLRSAAHVIDMHQLTKDPTIVLDAHKTVASPERTMSHFELTRYLDYCAEMLALIGKLAALYAERMRDSVVIDAVNEMEALTTSLGRKIWQKITIISALEETG
ncbi:hypothetical protein [Terricaulis sp.]|uniref:hypothetical protein n=1 Tax=Terricaulis sp. TaxID=2768686 RepID=UPI0037846CF0